MNQPDRYSRFVLPEGKAKVEYAVDTKNKNAGTYTIRLEDHTLGNLLRTQLHADEAVIFAGYRIPHPLDPLMVVRVQTTDAKTPQDAVAHAIQDLKQEVEELKASLAPQLGIDPAAAGLQPPGGLATAPSGGFGGPPAGVGYDGYGAPPGGMGYGGPPPGGYDGF
jgi:DNA-directed RNA polymerase II subunit RPB11